MFLAAAKRISATLLVHSSKHAALAFCLPSQTLSPSYALLTAQQQQQQSPTSAATATSTGSAHSSRGNEATLRRYSSSMNSMSAAVGSPEVVPAPKCVVAACQILCGEDKAANTATAEKAVAEAAAAGAQVVVLPECWNSPYDTASFPVNAEPVPEPGEAMTESWREKSPSTVMLCRAAADNGVYLVGGSVPEVGKDGGVYNTCLVVDPSGKILAKHRKVHLFDIDVPGGITFKESDTLSAGNSITTVDTPFGKIGVGICYDIRFPELSMAMRAAGSVLLCFPGAFNMTTGPAHWELLQRARALDNQCYVVTASPARNPESKYQAWGHSSIVDPWGKVAATTGHESDMVLAEIDLGRVTDIRNSIPVSLQKRADLYRLEVS